MKYFPKTLLAQIALVWVIILAAIAAVLLIPASDAEAAPKARTSIVWGSTWCGLWYKPSYVPCRYGTVKRRVKDYRSVISGNFNRDYRYIYMSLADVGDYGPNSWFGRFRFIYNEPVFHRARTCRGTMIVNARNGRAIRVQSRRGC